MFVGYHICIKELPGCIIQGFVKGVYTILLILVNQGKGTWYYGVDNLCKHFHVSIKFPCCRNPGHLVVVVALWSRIDGST